MIIQSITFSSEHNKIISEYLKEVGGDVLTKEYFDSSSYLADFPDRPQDCDAMGWE